MRGRLLRQDFIAGLAIVAVAAFALWLARILPGAAGGAMGPGTLPKGLALLLGVLGFALAGRSLLEKKGAALDADPEGGARPVRRCA